MQMKTKMLKEIKGVKANRTPWRVTRQYSTCVQEDAPGGVLILFTAMASAAQRSPRPLASEALGKA